MKPAIVSTVQTYFHSISLKSLDSETTISHTLHQTSLAETFIWQEGNMVVSKKTNGHIITDPPLLEGHPHKQCKTFDMCNTMRIPATKTYKTPPQIDMSPEKGTILKKEAGSSSKPPFFRGVLYQIGGVFLPSTTRGCCISPPPSPSF